MMRKIKEFICSDYIRTIEGKEDQILTLKSQITEFKSEIIRFNSQVGRLIEEKKKESFEEEIDNKWIKSPIKYRARNNNLYDVRSFIAYPSAVMRDLNAEIRIIPDDKNDVIAYKILQYAIKKFKYKIDETEDWQFPEDFINNNFTGDCEDGSNLIISLMRNANVPAFRIKNACGWVFKGKQKIGHSYPIYLRESDDEWVQLDWCFYPNNQLIKDRNLAKENKLYGEIWWTFNDIYSWSQKEVEYIKKVRNEPKK